ncbi:efflux RND transporter periplasmic adaptor subunit [Chitinophaga alhagiae]|uniref:efflux RND transporter periplasmic adaptor subunit n=1 Tax=Chitinophaga alhagiae TaxID=2203219 RepID=UPI000E5A18E1|nr:efflux RND transporter periplasmic adaptor subunit [Chitinophaga alhagiae]
MKKNIIIIVAIALSACGNKGKAPAADSTATEPPHTENMVEITEAQFNTIRLQTGGLEQRELSGTIKVNGLLDVPPQQMLSISMPIGGILRHTDLLEGYWVKKGQVIAQMEHPDYIQLQQDYLEAKAQLAFMDQEYERQKELSAENVSAKKTFQKTDADRNALKVRVEALKQKLLLMNIAVARLEGGAILRTIPVLAPISGYVTRVNANVGKYVSPNEPLFEIVDTEHLHAELTVFEKDIPRLKIGNKVRFILSNESKERTATVHLIGREIDKDRTIRVHCHLDREDKEMLPGTYLKAWVETGAARVPALPAAAVVMEAGREYVFVATEAARHYRKVEIKTGVTAGGYTEVILPEELPADAQFVTQGAHDLLAKMANSGEEGGHAH